jgi:hypothetical protein
MKDEFAWDLGHENWLHRCALLPIQHSYPHLTNAYQSFPTCKAIFFCSQFQLRHSCAARTSAKQNRSVTAYLFPSDQRPHYFEMLVLSRKKMPCNAVFSDRTNLSLRGETQMIRPNGRTPVKQRTTSLTPSMISAASFIDSQLSRQRQLSHSFFIIQAGRSEHPRTCRICELNFNSGGPWIRSVFAAEYFVRIIASQAVPPGQGIALACTKKDRFD